MNQTIPPSPTPQNSQADQTPQTAPPTSPPNPLSVQNPNTQPPSVQYPNTKPPNVNTSPSPEINQPGTDVHLPKEQTPSNTETSPPGPAVYKPEIPVPSDGPVPSDKGTVETSNKKIIGVIVAVIAVILTIAGLTVFLIGKEAVNRINPADQFADSRNANRKMDVLQISTAVSMYLAGPENSITDFGNIAQCSSGTSTIGTSSGNIDLASRLVPDYTTVIPTDPTDGSDGNTGYTICITSTGEVTIGAPGAENGESISETRM